MPRTRLPPPAWLHPKIQEYWRLGHGDTRIVEEITKDIAQHPEYSNGKYSISIPGVYRARRTIGLLGTRQRVMAGLGDDFRPLAEKLKKEHPKVGARTMVAYLLREHGMKVSEQRVLEYFQELRRKDEAGTSSSPPSPSAQPQSAAEHGTNAYIMAQPATIMSDFSSW
uniref:Uncharacterized protein n=1 Tax=Mycena chlorophos TaxID=658473 RepID=A0ABQ0LBX5_MYCCL|nr:predicted protein [Mycena chlorophos]